MRTFTRKTGFLPSTFEAGQSYPLINRTFRPVGRDRLKVPSSHHMKRIIERILRRFGYEKAAQNQAEAFLDFSEAQREIIAAVRPFTMTTNAGLATVLHAINHVTENNIPGDFVECGVWRGGCMMMAAKALLARGDTSRKLYLFDTYTGMSPPTEHDKTIDGYSAVTWYGEVKEKTWCYASLEEVRANLLSTGYPADKIILVEGKVEETIPAVIPSRVAFLRLDTDWYESTRHELEHLFPRLEPQGVLILDDYGHWQGARKAIDDYFRDQGGDVFLHRIDYTGRILVKTGNPSSPTNPGRASARL